MCFEILFLCSFRNPQRRLAGWGLLPDAIMRPQVKKTVVGGVEHHHCLPLKPTVLTGISFQTRWLTEGYGDARRLNWNHKPFTWESTEGARSDSTWSLCLSPSPSVQIRFTALFVLLMLMTRLTVSRSSELKWSDLPLCWCENRRSLTHGQISAGKTSENALSLSLMSFLLYSHFFYY